jgi:4-carboxymuconolactone decarboxylase
MSDELYQTGLEIRRAVVGRDHVDRSLAEADDFTRPLQDLVTRYCWGAVWGRPGLERRERSMINLSMIAALNRPHELNLHVRGALSNGVSRTEIREILLQVAAYCGFPAALDSFRVAKEVFAEIDKTAPTAPES